MNEPTNLELHHMGWNWFQVHAQQRMQLVSFWFLAMSFLTSGAVVAFDGGLNWLGVVVSAAIVGSSVASYFLDLRTQELIAYGERLMARAEAGFSMDGGPVRLALDMHGDNRQTISYGRLFKYLYLGGGVFGLALAVVGRL